MVRPVAEPTTERWLCIGKRLMANDKLATGFLDAAGERLFYVKCRGVAGSYYDVSVTRADGKCTMHGAPQYVEQHEDAAYRAQLRAEERVDELIAERDRAEARAKRTTELRALCEPLRELYRKQVGWPRKAAFLSLVQLMISGESKW